MAFVNAPFSWPKISDSMSVGEIAPQLKAMNGFVAAARKRVDRVGDDFFARARLADDEDVGVGVGDHLDLFEEPLHARRLADEMAEGAHLLELTTKLEDLLLHHLLVFDGLENDLKARQIDRFGDVVLGANLERLDRGIDRRVTGQDDDGNVRIVFLHPVKEVEPGAVGQFEIDDGDVGNELADRVPSGFHRVGDFGLVAPLFDHVGHTGTGGPIIINNQDSSHRAPRGKDNRTVTLSRSRSSAASSSPPYVSAMSLAVARERSGFPSGSV